MDKRIEELEHRVAFLDETTQRLSDEVFRQGKVIVQLQTHLDDAINRLRQMADVIDVDESPHQPPPHY